MESTTSFYGDTPKAVFDKSTYTYSIVGNSYMENCIDFYKPIKEFVENYESNGYNELNLLFHYNLLNSSSSVYLAQIILNAAKLVNKDINVNIEWMYDINDEELFELGQKLENLSKLPFKYTSVKD